MVKQNFDVVSFGSAVVDSFVHTNVAERKNFIYYPVGEKILINELSTSIGGGGTNTAVAFARLGLKTGCICKVGNDSNGKLILELLNQEDVKFIGKIDKKMMSGSSIILDSRGGERTILTYKGANDDISYNELSIDKLNSKWLYYSALLGKSFETQKKVALIMHKKGTKIAFNPSSYIINNEDFSSLMKICEVLIVNKEEAEMICKRYIDNPSNKVTTKDGFSIYPTPNKSDTIKGIEYNKKGDLWESIHELGVKIVLITDKDNPAVCFDGKEKYSITPHKNIKVIERTGAGDAFASGFVAGLIIGWKIPKCLELGLKESESVITSRGAKNKLLRMRLKKR